jgi:hypothetical protein
MNVRLAYVFIPGIPMYICIMYGCLYSKDTFSDFCPIPMPYDSEVK